MSDCGENAEYVLAEEATHIEEPELGKADAIQLIYKELGDKWRLTGPFDLYERSELIKRTKGFWKRMQLRFVEYGGFDFLDALSFIALVVCCGATIAVLLSALYYEDGLVVVHSWNVKFWLLPVFLGVIAYLWYIRFIITSLVNEKFYKWEQDCTNAIERNSREFWTQFHMAQFNETGFRLGYSGQKFRTIVLRSGSGEETTICIQSVEG